VLFFSAASALLVAAAALAPRWTPWRLAARVALGYLALVHLAVLASLFGAPHFASGVAPVYLLAFPAILCATLNAEIPPLLTTAEVLKSYAVLLWSALVNGSILYTLAFLWEWPGRSRRRIP
jgi:hypothetical protein